VERLLGLAATGTDKDSNGGGSVKLPPSILGRRGQLYFPPHPFWHCEHLKGAWQSQGLCEIASAAEVSLAKTNWSVIASGAWQSHWINSKCQNPSSKQIQISQLIYRNPNFKTQMTIEIQMLKCQNYPFFPFEFWA